MVAWFAGSSRSGSSTPIRSTSAGPELRLERADAHVLPVGRLVEVVPRGAAVEQARAPLARRDTEGCEGPRHGGEVGGAVDDRRVDDLALPARPGLEERSEDADDEVGRAAAEVAEQVAREVRSLAVLPEAVEGAGGGDVVHVVAGHLAPRAVLAPAGHPAVDQSRVAGVALGGPEAEPLEGAGTHPLDEDVRPLDQREDGGHRLRSLEVERDARPAAVEQVLVAHGEHPAARPVDADHVGAEVGQGHAGVRARPDPGDLDHLHAPQRSGALPQLVRHGVECDTGAVRVPGRVRPLGRGLLVTSTSRLRVSRPRLGRTVSTAWATPPSPRSPADARPGSPSGKAGRRPGPIPA